MQSMGLGGGCFMTIYSKEEGKVMCLNARETAPEMSASDMFKGDYRTSMTGSTSFETAYDIEEAFSFEMCYTNYRLNRMQ